MNILDLINFCTPFLKGIIFYGRVYEVLQLPGTISYDVIILVRYSQG